MNDTKQVTEWYPGTIMPVHVGVYERDTVYQTLRFSYWDGRHWYVGGSTPDQALGAPAADVSHTQTLRWRGMTEQQPRTSTESAARAEAWLYEEIANENKQRQKQDIDWLTPTGVDLWRGLPRRAKWFLIAWALTLLTVAVFVDWR